jgi:REP element-mobilizing transposase RayT
MVVQKIKANLSREYGLAFNAVPPLWARGYLARSTGRVQVERVKSYLDSQSEHHGYHKRVRPPVFRYRATNIPRLTAAHSFFDLTHHLVFATRYRVGFFDSAIGEALAKYWLHVALKRGFAIEQVSILPDHVHLMVKTVAKMSVEDCALILMNNGQYFAGKHFSSALVQAGIERLWQTSAYAGTCGQMTTALLKSFLSRAD